MRYLVCIAALIVCCGDDDEPVDCSKTDRHGIYRVSTIYNSGSCGDLGTFSVQLDHGNESGDCIVHNDEWSKDECTLTRSMTCTIFVTGGPNGSVTYTYSWHQISTQKDSDGDMFAGPVSLQVSGSDGSACHGSYHFTYTRI